MAVDIDYIKRKYFYKNKPVEYKLRCNKIIKIYPVLVEDYDIFEENYDILTKMKNEINSPEIIRMSYLQFIIEFLIKQDEIYKYKLYNIINLCLKEDDISVGYDKNKLVLVISKNDIVEYKINHKDFDDIKKIILYQNLINYDDTYISKDIRNVIEEYYKAKNGDIVELSLEDKMAFLGNNCGFSYDEMLKMSYREFSNRFDWAVEEMDYKINKTAEMSGNVQFDRKIEHLIYKKKKNKLEQFFVDKDKFTDKINKSQS